VRLRLLILGILEQVFHFLRFSQNQPPPLLSLSKWIANWSRPNDFSLVTITPCSPSFVLTIRVPSRGCFIRMFLCFPSLVVSPFPHSRNCRFVMSFDCTGSLFLAHCPLNSWSGFQLALYSPQVPRPLFWGTPCLHVPPLIPYLQVSATPPDFLFETNIFFPFVRGFSFLTHGWKTPNSILYSPRLYFPSHRLSSALDFCIFNSGLYPPRLSFRLHLTVYSSVLISKSHPFP